MIERLSFKSPLVSVFLRRLAWEEYLAKKSISVKDAISEYVQAARRELGLEQYGDRSTSGGADAFLQKQYAENISKIDGQLKLTDQKWKDEWRLLYLPPHNVIRELSVDPVIEEIPNSEGVHHFRINLRNPAIPTLDLYTGAVKALANACPGRRGIYFLGSDAGLYVGKTDEFETRSRFHIEKNSKWSVFFSIAEQNDLFTLDSLGASEGLLISFWNEITTVTNGNRGCDRRPAFVYLQQAILFAEGAAASLLWLARNHHEEIVLPFKGWSGQSGWADRYLGHSSAKVTVDRAS